MMFSKKDRTALDDTKLGFVFGFFGGFNNATALLVLLYEIGPMSANWGGMAEAIGEVDMTAIFTYSPLLLCFAFGAFAGSKWVEEHEPTPLVFLESIMLMSMAFIAPHTRVMAIMVGATSMGMQNGMTTAISHKAVRTSHLTSTVTDIGISLALGNYKGAMVKMSKTATYIWGATVGTTLVKAFHTDPHVTFAVGGFCLFTIISCHTLYMNFALKKVETLSAV